MLLIRTDFGAELMAGYSPSQMTPTCKGDYFDDTGRGGRASLLSPCP